MTEIIPNFIDVDVIVTQSYLSHDRCTVLHELRQLKTATGAYIQNILHQFLRLLALCRSDLVIRDNHDEADRFGNLKQFLHQHVVD